MGQERGWFTWRLIWKPVSRHLVEAGCFPQEGIARAAVDSLRQLAAKFLGQRELHGFRYQRDFLKPFHLILRKSKSKAIRLHSLRCLNHTVRQYHTKMKSGWETVLSMLESAATITEVNRLALTVLIDVLERNLPAVIDGRLLPNAVKAVSKFVIIGRSIRESALYVLAGVFEEMMKLEIAESELKPVLTAIGNAMIDVDAVLINLKIIRESIRPRYWSVVTPWVQHVILNKPERWFKRCGESLLEWAILGSADTHPDECLRLVMQSTRLPSLRILSVCARVLKAQLSQNAGAKDAATILAQGLISSLEVEDSQNEIEFMSGLVLDLAEILNARELLGVIHTLEGPAKKFAMSGRARLVLAISLVKRNEIAIDEVKTMANELFDGGNDGKKMVIDELMNLDDQYFEEIGRAITPHAAVVIASPNEELRKALANFFGRISRKWSAGDTK
jgi:hypothetical protein